MIALPPAAHRRRTSSAVAAGAMVFAGLTFAASPAQAADVFITPGQVTTSETRTAGHNVFTADGVRVYTDDNSSQAKAAGYFAVNRPLADVGAASMDVARNDTTTTLFPGKQLVVDFDGDGSADGLLVGEPTYADGSPLYGDNWWLTNGSKPFVKAGAPSHGGGFGSDNNGTLDQWRAAFTSAKVLQTGWSLGSGVKGDVTISSFTLGSITYKIRGAGAPVALDVSGSGPFGKIVQITPVAFDPEGAPLKYTVGKTDDGFTRVQVGKLVFQPKNGFAGTTSFSYTAKDPSGLTGSATVTVSIDKAASELVLTRRQPNAKGSVALSVTVDSRGKAGGGTIVIKEGGATVATAPAAATAKSTLVKFGPNISAGPHTYDVTFGGSAQVVPAAGSITTTVK